MQGIEHINFTNAKNFASQPGAIAAKAIEIYYRLNADELERFDKTGVLPDRLVKPAEAQGFDVFGLARAVRIVHADY